MPLFRSYGVTTDGSGNTIIENGLIILGGVNLGSSYTTPVETGTKTDYNISDLATYPEIIFLSSGNLDINSIVAPIQLNPSVRLQQFIFYNGNAIGGGTVTFKAGSAGAVVNTFEMFADIKLRAGSKWLFGYDYIISRWIALDKI